VYFRRTVVIQLAQAIMFKYDAGGLLMVCMLLPCSGPGCPDWRKEDGAGASGAQGASSCRPVGGPVIIPWLLPLSHTTVQLWTWHYKSLGCKRKAKHCIQSQTSLGRIDWSVYQSGTEFPACSCLQVCKHDLPATHRGGEEHVQQGTQ
jgi:hypothetical protein